MNWKKNRRIIFNAKSRLSRICLACMIVIGSACQKTPEQSYVVNKEGQDSLIADHESEDTGIHLREQIQVPERVDDITLELGDYLYSTLEANVEVPDTTAVPVYTIRPMALDSEQIRQFAECLFDGEAYKKNPNETLDTNLSIQAELMDRQEYLMIWENSDEPLDEIVSVTVDGIELTKRETMERLQAEIDQLNLELYRLQNEEPEYKKHPADYTYDTCIQKLYVNRYADEEKPDINYEFQSSETVGTKNGNTYVLQVAKDEEISMIHYYLADSGQPVYKDYTLSQATLIPADKDSLSTALAVSDNECDYSLAEAKELCMDTLKNMGISDMEIQAVFNVGLRPYGEEDESKGKAVGYDLYCYRTYDGVSDEYYKWDLEVYDSICDDAAALDPIMFDGREKYSGFVGLLQYNSVTGMYEHRVHRELLRVRITNYGITEIMMINPMETELKQADHVTLMDFDQILKYFETDMRSVYTKEYAENHLHYASSKKKFRIMKIEFHYAMMQSPYKEDEYTMIPVWDFKASSYGRTYLTVNAIDGSVFDRKNLH